MATSQLATDILSYLIEHPMAEDTVEGIVEWWILKQSIEQRVVTVKDALAQLVAGGFVLERKRIDGRIYYQLNQSSLEESKKIVSNQVDHHGLVRAMLSLGLVGIIKVLSLSHLLS
jgi:hypothetical protein